MGLAKTLALEPLTWLGFGRGTASASLPAPIPLATGQLDFAVATSVQDLARLEPEWNTLWAGTSGAASLFLSFNWVWHWCQHFLDSDSSRLVLVTGRRNGQLVMVWPLVIERVLGLKKAGFAGAPVSQYSDVLVDRTNPAHGSWVAEGWSYVQNQLAPDLVHFRKVRSDSALAVLLRQIAAKETNVQAAPFITLAGEPSFEEFDQRFSAKDRKNRRRKRKRLSEAGVVGFRRSSESQAAVARFTLAMQWKREWLDDGSLVSTALADDRFDRFFESILAATDRPVGAEVFELTLDDRPIAVKVAITSGAYRGMHLTAYDKAHEKSSPGGLLVEEMIEAGLVDGAETLDFLAPAYPYKLEWAAGTVAVSDYSFAVTPAGALYDGLYVQRMRPQMQRLATNGPASLRRLAASLVKAGRTPRASTRSR